MLYHTPASPYYARTSAEATFDTEEEAQAAGYSPWRPRPRAGASTTAADIPDGDYGPGSARPAADGSAPRADFVVKANAGSRLYHTPASPSFRRTRAEQWFLDEDTARAAGFIRWDDPDRPRRGAQRTRSAADVPPGRYGAGSADPASDGSAPHPDFTVKGNAGSMLFHPPTSPYYGRTRAEVWFLDEDTAVAAGFIRWNDPARRDRRR